MQRKLRFIEKQSMKDTPKRFCTPCRIFKCLIGQFIVGLFQPSVSPMLMIFWFPLISKMALPNQLNSFFGPLLYIKMHPQVGRNCEHPVYHLPNLFAYTCSNKEAQLSYQYAFTNKPCLSHQTTVGCWLQIQESIPVYLICALLVICA